MHVYFAIDKRMITTKTTVVARLSSPSDMGCSIFIDKKNDDNDYDDDDNDDDDDSDDNDDDEEAKRLLQRKSP